MLKNIPIVFISDDKYMVNTAVAITSLKHNRNTNIHYDIFVISDNVSKEKLDKIKSLKDINFSITIIEYANNLDIFAKKSTYVSVAALTKFFLAEILNNYDKVIYVDGDVVIQKDLEDLYDISLNDNYAAAVRDVTVEQRSPTPSQKLNKELNYYFNSGMMLLNLKIMRENDVGEKLLEYKKSGINYFMDQDALNVIFDNNVVYIPCKYNYKVFLYENARIDDLSQDFGFDVSKTEIERLVEASIIHFAGKNKPWDVYLPFLTDIYMKYYNLSPFADIAISPLKTENTPSYLFPFELVEKNSKIAIWGAGKVGTVFYEQVKYTNYCDIILWVDSKAKDVSPHKESVALPDELKGIQLDYIVIAVKREELAKSIKDEIYDLIGRSDNVIWRYPELP